VVHFELPAADNSVPAVRSIYFCASKSSLHHAASEAPPWRCSPFL